MAELFRVATKPVEGVVGGTSIRVYGVGTTLELNAASLAVSDGYTHTVVDDATPGAIDVDIGWHLVTPTDGTSEWRRNSLPTELDLKKELAVKTILTLDAWDNELLSHERGATSSEISKSHDILQRARVAVYAIFTKSTGIDDWTNLTLGELTSFSENLLKGPTGFVTPLSLYGLADAITPISEASLWVDVDGNTYDLSSVIKFPLVSAPSGINVASTTWVDSIEG